MRKVGTEFLVGVSMFFWGVGAGFAEKKFDKLWEGDSSNEAKISLFTNLLFIYFVNYSELRVTT